MIEVGRDADLLIAEAYFRAKSVPYHLDLIETALLDCTHFLAIGTSGQVWPAAGMLQVARQRGAETFVQALVLPANADSRDTFVAGRAAEVVPDLLLRITN